MIAALHELSVLHDEDPVGFPRIDQAVRDEDHRLPAGQRPDPVHDDLFALHVNVAGRLVKDIDRAVMQQGSRKGKSLFLSAREVLCVFRQPQVQGALFAGECIHPAGPKHFQEPLIGGRRIAHEEVVPDRSLKEIAGRPDICDASHQALLRAVCDRDPAYGDLALLCCKPPCEERRNGRFPASALADDPHEAVLWYLHVDPVQDFPLPVVGKAHAL